MTAIDPQSYPLGEEESNGYDDQPCRECGTTETPWVFASLCMDCLQREDPQP